MDEGTSWGANWEASINIALAIGCLLSMSCVLKEENAAMPLLERLCQHGLVFLIVSRLQKRLAMQWWRWLHWKRLRIWSVRNACGLLYFMAAHGDWQLNVSTIIRSMICAILLHRLYWCYNYFCRRSFSDDLMLTCTACSAWWGLHSTILQIKSSSTHDLITIDRHD